MLGRFGKKTYISLGAVFTLLIFFNYVGWLNPVKNLLHGIFIPVFTKTNAISINLNENYLFFKNKYDFFAAYREAEQKARGIQALSAANDALTKENEELKKLLDFKESMDTPLVTARVIGKNTDGTQKSIIIDHGEDNGLKVGQPVISENGILVGKVIKTEKKISNVGLINDSQSKIAAVVLNETSSPGVVEGGYGLSVKMNFIPRNEVVLSGDRVITSGLEQNIPRGLFLGQVVAVENETYQPFQEALISPGVDLDKLFLVGVILTI